MKKGIVKKLAIALGVCSAVIAGAFFCVLQPFSTAKTAVGQVENVFTDSVRVSLGNRLSISFQLVDATSVGKVEFTTEDGSFLGKGVQTKYNSSFVNSAAVCTGIGAQYMATKVTATAYGINNELLGTKVVSIEDYCKKLLSSETSGEGYKRVAADMLAYGNAATNYYNAKYGKNIETPSIPDSATTFVESEVSSGNYTLTGDSSSLVRWKSAALQISDEISYFILFEAKDTTNLSVKDGKNNTITYEKYGEEENVYSVTLAVSAANLHNDITLQLYNGEEKIGKQLTYNVKSYVNAMKDDEQEPLLGELCKRIWNYGKSVYALKNGDSLSWQLTKAPTLTETGELVRKDEKQGFVFDKVTVPALASPLVTASAKDGKIDYTYQGHAVGQLNGEKLPTSATDGWYTTGEVTGYLTDGTAYVNANENYTGGASLCYGLDATNYAEGTYTLTCTLTADKATTVNDKAVTTTPTRFTFTGNVDDGFALLLPTAFAGGYLLAENIAVEYTAKQVTPPQQEETFTEMSCITGDSITATSVTECAKQDGNSGKWVCGCSQSIKTSKYSDHSIVIETGEVYDGAKIYCIKAVEKGNYRVTFTIKTGEMTSLYVNSTASVKPSNKIDITGNGEKQIVATLTDTDIIPIIFVASGANTMVTIQNLSITKV